MKEPLLNDAGLSTPHCMQSRHNQGLSGDTPSSAICLAATMPYVHVMIRCDDDPSDKRNPK
jgi:hypothetical protein